MNLSHLAVRRPVTVLMGVAIILVLGVVSMTQLPIDLMPGMEIPILAVQTSYSNAGPHEVENLVTRPIEEALGAVTNVSSINSTSSRGSSVVITQFDWGVDMDFASLDVREMIDLVKGMLPDDAGDPIIFKFDPASQPIIDLVIAGNRPLHELRHLAESTVKNRLERLDGVASVTVTGGQVREIKVELHPGLMKSFGITVETVSQALRTANMNLPAGNVVDDNLAYLVRTTGEFRTVDEIRNLPIATITGDSVRLADIADVIDGYKDVTHLSRYNGQPSVMLSVQKEASANTLQVAEVVRETISQMNRELTEGLELLIAQDTSLFITESVNNVTSNAVYGAVLAMIVLLIFLRSFRTTLVIGLAIPISIVSTFVLMFFSNTSLNMISLGGLALGVGMLVDNGIVVLENIFRHREMGKDAISAAKLGAEEVGTAITASTLTTVSVFLPVVFVSGIAAEIFRDMVLTVSFALLASLLVSLALVPMLASRLLGNVQLIDGKIKGNKFQQAIGTVFDRIQLVYGHLVRWVLCHRVVTVGVAIAALIVSLGLLPQVGMEFFPNLDQGGVSVSIQLPRGTQLEETDRLVRQVEEYITTIPEIGVVHSSIGSGGGMGLGGGSSSEHRGTVHAQLVPLDQRQRSSSQIVLELREYVGRIPGADITVRQADMAMGVMGGAPVHLNLRGDDLEELNYYAEQVQNRISSIPGVVEATNSLEASDTEVRVVVDRGKAASYGVTIGQVASTLRTAVSGLVATQFRTGGQEIDVTIRLAEPWRRSSRDIEAIPVTTPRGTVPLGELATLQRADSPISINRSEGSRTVSVTGQIVGRDLNSVMRDVNEELTHITLPSDIQIVEGGEIEQMMDAYSQLLLAMFLGVLLVYMVLASQFESLAQPLIIMFTLPMAVIGVVGGLLVYRVTFNVVAFVGIIMLAGIVVNNAIVLIDFINQLRERGRSRFEALVEAGEKRLRPIIMTTLTTVFAMMPLALGIGEGSEMQQPIAIVVIGGLLTSTLLTLLIIPVVYTLVDDLTEWLKKISNRRDRNLVQNTNLN